MASQEPQHRPGVYSAADALLLRGDRIVAVGEGADLARRLSRQDTRIDCAGATALPGLIDAHVHLELNPDDRSPPLRTDPGQRPLMAARALAMVNAGITTARDLGGGAWLELALRDRIAAGQTPGPRLLCAGQPITCPGGHCHFWGGEAAGLNDALVVMQRQIDRGADLIKVMATGGRMTRGSRPLAPQFDLATLQGIVDAARAHGRAVAAHCHGTTGIELAAQAGVATIEHCSWVGPQGWAADYQETVAALILTRGIAVSPTINRGWQRMLDNPDSTTLDRIRHALESMRALGIRFIASTDAGIPGVYHHELPQALAVFSAIARLSPTATLRAATVEAAAAIGLGAETGQLCAGLAADVLLVDGDPLSDLAALTRPVGVWARGRLIRQP